MGLETVRVLDIQDKELPTLATAFLWAYIEAFYGTEDRLSFQILELDEKCWNLEAKYPEYWRELQKMFADRVDPNERVGVSAGRGFDQLKEWLVGQGAAIQSGKEESILVKVWW